MDQAVTVLLLAILATLGMGVTAIGLSFKARGEQASKFAAAEVERQNLANEERQRALKDREALANSLEEFRTQFASERMQRIERDREVTRLNEQKRVLDNKLDDLLRNQRQNEAAIAALEQKNAALEQKNAAIQGDLDNLRKETAELRAELAIVKTERDVALATVDKKNGELKEARATIERMEQVLQEQTRELSDIRERLAKLETKPPDTGALPPINPASTEHQDGKDAHPPSAE